MVGADADRKAVEHSSWSNGAFTHCLLQGLHGKADGFQSAGKKDNSVTTQELPGTLQCLTPKLKHNFIQQVNSLSKVDHHSRWGACRNNISTLIFTDNLPRHVTSI